MKKMTQSENEVKDATWNTASWFIFTSWIHFHLSLKVWGKMCWDGGHFGVDDVDHMTRDAVHSANPKLEVSLLSLPQNASLTEKKWP